LRRSLGNGWHKYSSNINVAERSKASLESRLEFLTTNNIAKYEAVLLGLRKLRALGVKRCIVRSDSQVIIGHVEKEFTAKEPKLVKYLAAVRRMEKHFVGFTFRHIPRSENAKLDELAKAAAQKAPMPVDIFYQELSVKAIQEEEERPCSMHAIASKDWMSPIFTYLIGTYKPQSKHEIDRMNSRTKQYSIIEGELYKSGIIAPMLKCISKEQGIQLPSEMHVGMCGLTEDHTGSPIKR
jgi:ribonuclease HI